LVVKVRVRLLLSVSTLIAKTNPSKLLLVTTVSNKTPGTVAVANFQAGIHKASES
jgi:hypothetical protein